MKPIFIVTFRFQTLVVKGFCNVYILCGQTLNRGALKGDSPDGTEIHLPGPADQGVDVNT